MTTANHSPAPGALTGIRVIDLTTVLMGPLSTRMLGDHGADVVRVIGPGVVDDPGAEDGNGGIGLDIHRNKRSVRLDLKTEAGTRAMAELIASADVVVSNMRSAALDRLGLSAERLRARHPGLIHCVANGYGPDGPSADLPAYDDAIQAGCGLAALFERLDGEPRYVPNVVADKVCALFITQAVLAALLHRHNTGEGQTITVPMFETMVSFVSIEHVRGAAAIPPRGEVGYRRLLTPNRKPYRCADGWVALLPYSDANWRDFFDGVGEPEVLDDPRFADHGGRVDHADELYGHLDRIAPGRTVQEWLDFCAERSIPANPVLDLADLPTDPQVEASGLMPVVEHPTAGPYRTVRQPVLYDTMSTELRHHAPVGGQDTAEVLAELGWSPDQVAEVAGPAADG